MYRQGYSLSQFPPTADAENSFQRPLSRSLSSHVPFLRVPVPAATGREVSCHLWPPLRLIHAAQRPTSARGPAGPGAPAHLVLSRTARLQPLHDRYPPQSCSRCPETLPSSRDHVFRDGPFVPPSRPGRMLERLEFCDHAQGRNVTSVSGVHRVGAHLAFGQDGAPLRLACRVGRRYAEVRQIREKASDKTLWPDLPPATMRMTSESHFYQKMARTGLLWPESAQPAHAV